MHTQHLKTLSLFLLHKVLTPLGDSDGPPKAGFTWFLLLEMHSPHSPQFCSSLSNKLYLTIIITAVKLRAFQVLIQAILKGRYFWVEILWDRYYWVGQKVQLSLSIISYVKIPMNFLANPILLSFFTVRETEGWREQITCLRSHS